jgi:hypothetical protein
VKTVHRLINHTRQFICRPKLKLTGLTTTALAMVVFGSGCVHQLEVINQSAYQTNSMSPLRKPLTIGLVPTIDATNQPCEQLVKGIGRALGSYSATVFLPYSAGGNQRADVVANIQIGAEYAGSGWNFLINWPGFLIFTPAWNGYVYKANLQVDIQLAKGADNAPIDSWTMPFKLDLRQAEMDRTWTEVGWLEWGVIPLIGGMVFISYDTDVTPILMEKIERPVGDYIAQEMVNRINRCDSLFVPAQPANKPVASPPVAPVVPPKEAPIASPPETNAVNPGATNVISSPETPVTSPPATNAVPPPETPIANPPETNAVSPPETNAASPQNQ